MPLPALTRAVHGCLHSQGWWPERLSGCTHISVQAALSSAESTQPEARLAFFKTWRAWHSQKLMRHSQHTPCVVQPNKRHAWCSHHTLCMARPADAMCGATSRYHGASCCRRTVLLRALSNWPASGRGHAGPQAHSVLHTSPLWLSPGGRGAWLHQTAEARAPTQRP